MGEKETKRDYGRVMLIRNIIEIVILVLIFAVIWGIYVYAKRKVMDIESDLTIMYKSDLAGNQEEVDNIE